MMSNSQWLKRNMCLAYVCVLTCWGLCSYFELFKFFQNGTLFARVMDGRPYVSDFVTFYNGAMLAAECGQQPINIYDPELQNSGITQLIAPIKPESNFYMQSPPQFFAIVRPLAGLGIENAWLVWCGLALLLILLALWQLSKLAGQSKFARAFVLISFFASFPTWMAFNQGQTALYLFPAIVAFYFLLRSNKYFLSGLLSAILLVKLQYTPVIVVTGLILGRMRYLAGLALSAGLLSLWAVSAVGWNNILAYPSALLFAETSPQVCGVNAYSMQNFRGELALICGQDNSFVHFLSTGLFMLGFIVVSSMWLWLYPRIIRIGALSKEQAFDTCFALTILGMLIFSPHTHVQDFVCASVSAVLLYRALDLASSGSIRLKTVKLLLVAFPLLSWIFFNASTFLAMAFIQPYFLWTVAIILLVLTELKVKLKATY